MGYRGKVEEQEKARALRARNHTLADIAQVLGVSKSSVSLWVREHPAEQARAWLRVRVLLMFEDPPRNHGPHPCSTIVELHSGVAQLVEQRPVKPMAAGSSPAPGALPHTPPSSRTILPNEEKSSRP